MESVLTTRQRCVRLYGDAPHHSWSSPTYWFSRSFLRVHLPPTAVQSPPAALSYSGLSAPHLSPASLIGCTRGGGRSLHRCALLCGSPPCRPEPAPTLAAGSQTAPPGLPGSGPAPWHWGMTSGPGRCFRTWSSPRSSGRPPLWWWRRSASPTGSPRGCRRCEPAWWCLWSPPHLEARVIKSQKDSEQGWSRTAGTGAELNNRTTWRKNTP